MTIFVTYARYDSWSESSGDSGRACYITDDRADADRECAAMLAGYGDSESGWRARRASVSVYDSLDDPRLSDDIRGMDDWSARTDELLQAVI